MPIGGARGALTDRSGTITEGGTAQELADENTSRQLLFIQNASAGDLWIDIGDTAVEASPSVRIRSGEYVNFEVPGYVPTGAVSIIGGTTGQAFTAKEA